MKWGHCCVFVAGVCVYVCGSGGGDGDGDDIGGSSGGMTCLGR